MEFVKTTKRFREDTIIIEDRSQLTPEGYYTPAIDEKRFNELTIAYEHGTTIKAVVWLKIADDHGYTHWEQTKMVRKIKKQYPSPEWHYDMVSIMPKTYNKCGIRTMEEAYAFGKKLIEAVYKSNRIDYNVMVEDYLAIARLFEKCNITYACKNSMVKMTAKAEVKAAKEIEELRDYERFTQVEYSDEELHFYARAFSIELPKWYLRYSLVKTANGWAKLPQVVTDGTAKLEYRAEGQAGYAGNEEHEIAPYRMQKDAVPVEIIAKQREQLSDTIAWFRALDIEEQKTFLADGFEFDEHNNIVELDPEVIEQRELDTIAEAYEEYQKTH